MDIATIGGLLLAMGLVIGSILLGGGLGVFVDAPSMMIVFGGSFASIFVAFPMKQALGTAMVIKNCFLFKLPSPNEVISQFSEFATTARRDGLLALEDAVENIDDVFLKRGLEQAVGGTSAEELLNVLELEVEQFGNRHTAGKKIVDAIAAAAPAFGMIGTLIGLVQMLNNLSDPSQIGGGMAVALLTTLYGAVIANMFCIPLASKLENRAVEETMIRELMIAGLVSLVEGHAPRAVEERLQAFLAPKARVDSSAQQAA
jgi:chemotaxis protein MotA